MLKYPKYWWKFHEVGELPNQPEGIGKATQIAVFRRSPGEYLEILPEKKDSDLIENGPNPYKLVQTAT